MARSLLAAVLFGLPARAQSFLDGPVVVVEEGMPAFTALPYDVSESSESLWELVVLPKGVIYPSYLAGSKESRMAFQLIREADDGPLLDATLGGRFGLLRWGPRNERRGFQIDLEGSAQLRLDLEEEMDLRGVDFRAGVPFTYGWANHQIKFGYYHLSSHTGDEFLLKNVGFERVNFVRDVLVLGYSYDVTERLRLYGEAGWAFWSDYSEPWEFQMGLDYAPKRATGVRGAPFFALHGHLREEVKFGGNITAQAGWAWRGDGPESRMFRMGAQYYNGQSPQYSFFKDFEEQFGFGMWYDY
ncbi:MAG: DUF1207 domain-containing protein [Pirellulaceae bacterium]